MKVNKIMTKAGRRSKIRLRGLITRTNPKTISKKIPRRSNQSLITLQKDLNVM